MEDKLYKVDLIDLANDNVRLSEITTNQTKSMSVTELSLFFTEEQKKERAVDSAIDTVLNGEPEIIIENSPVTVSPETPPFTDMRLIAEIIKQGERYERNEDIQNFFAENEDIDLRAGYISSIYRDEPAQLEIGSFKVGYEKTENGLTIWQGTSENREKQSTLSWDSVQAMIAESIERNKFVDVLAEKTEIPDNIAPKDIEKFFSEDVTDIENTENISKGRHIRCETEEEAEQLFDYLRDNEYMWDDGEELTVTDWIYGESDTFYTVDEDNKTVEIGNVNGYSPDKIQNMNIEYFSDVKNEFVSGIEFTEPEQTAEKKYDLHFSYSRENVNVYDFSDGTDSEPIAVIDSDRNVAVNTDLPKSILENIYEYANGMSEIYKLPEIRKPHHNEPTVTITFAETPSALYKGLTMPFSQADEIFGAADKNYVDSRNNKYSGDNFIGYSKIDFEIKGGSDNPDFTYSGRYDLGDGENGLLNHIKNNYDYLRSEEYVKNISEDDIEDYRHELNELAKELLYLEKHLDNARKPEWSAYTQYIDDVEIAQIGRKIDESRPLSGGNVEYCSGIFSDDDEQGFNVNFAQSLAEQLNKKGIVDLKEAQGYVNSEIAERDDFSDIKTDKTIAATEQSVQYAACFSRAANIDKGITSYIVESDKIHDESLVAGTFDSYKGAVDALEAFQREHSISEIFEMCPYYEREIKRGFEITVDGTDYQIYDIDRENNTVELAKPEDIDTTIAFIQRNESNKPPVRTESFDYINSLVNEKSIVPNITKSVDELTEGDIIRYKDITGKISEMNSDMITVETGTHPTLGKMVSGIMFWQDKFKNDGFEYLGHEDYAREENVSRKKSGKSKEITPDDGQLDLFGVDYSNEPVVPKEYPQNVVDDFLRCGGYNSHSAERIVAQYMKDKTTAENADFLREEFKDFSCGHITDGSKYSMTADNDGIHINHGETALGRDSELVSWEKAAERIGELLENGEYATQDILNSSKNFSLDEAAVNICFIQRDLDEKYRDKFFLDKENFTVSFPERSDRIAEQLRDKNTLEEYIKGAAEFAEKCKENSYNLPSYVINKINNLPKMLDDLRGTPKLFNASPDFDIHIQSFVSKDEIEKQILQGPNIVDSKGTIYDYFTDNHTDKEKLDFLKNYYGIGGSYSNVMGISYDSKGIEISHDNPYGDTAKALVSWKSVVREIDKAIKSGTYFTDKDRQEYVNNAKKVVKEAEKDSSYYSKGYVDNAKKIISFIPIA